LEEKTEKLKLIEQIKNIKVYKRDDWTYKLMFENNKNELTYSVESYEIIKEKQNYFYLKVKEKKYDKNHKNKIIVYKIPLKTEIKYKTIKFTTYTENWKKECSSEYDENNNKCYISSSSTHINGLKYKEKKLIKKLFGISIIDTLFNLFETK